MRVGRLLLVVVTLFALLVLVILECAGRSGKGGRRR